MAGNHDAYVQAMRVAIGLSRKRSWSAACESYRQAVVEFPGDLAATLGLGRSLLEMGQLQIALKILQRAAQLAPGDARALSSLADVQERLGMLEAAADTYHLMATAAAQQGNLREAADGWERAARLAPDPVEAYRLLASALEQLGRPAQAATEYATLASIYERKGNTSLARQFYREALRLDPGNSRVAARLSGLDGAARPGSVPLEQRDAEEPSSDETEGVFAFDTVQADETVGDESPFGRARRRALQELAETLFTVVEEDASRPTVVTAISRGIDQQTRGQTDEAIQSFSKALDGGYNRTALFFNLGALYYERRYYDKAIETFRHSMRDEDFRLGSHYALGLTYQAAGMPDRALEHFIEVVKAIDLQAVDAEQTGEMNLAYQQLTDRYLAKSDTQQAGTFIQTVTAFFSKPRWERRAHQARRDMNRLSEKGALMTLADYLESPDNEVIVTSLGLTDEYMQHRMLATAMEECLYAIEKVPYHLPLYVRLAEIQALQEHHDQAVTTYMTVAEVYEARGQPQQAVDICYKMLRQTPMEVRVRTKLVELLLSQHDIEQALEQYMALADTYYQLAEVDRALETYDETLRLVSKSPNRNKWEIEALHRMGDIFAQRVDWGRATWAYESIVALAPDDERARLQLIDLYLKQRQREKAFQSFDRLLALYNKPGKAQAIPTLLRDLVQAYADDMGLRAHVAAAYAAQGLSRQAIEEYAALTRMQLQAGLRDDACRTIQTIVNLDPQHADELRRLLSQIQGRVSPSVR